MADLKLLKQRIFSKKGSSLFLLFGMVGIALIFLSQFWPVSSSKATSSSSSVASSSDKMTNYAKEMEKSLDSIISNIAGVGKVQVMLTLKSGVQYEYEQNQKSTNSRTTDSMNSAQTQENSDTEQSTVLAENENGTQQPVIKAEMQPAVKGVVIVCEGGSDPIVKEEVLQAVMTALNVSATSVSINPMASPSQTVSNK